MIDERTFSILKSHLLIHVQGKKSINI